MRRNITEGMILFRRAWLRSIVDRVEVDADTFASSVTRPIWSRLSQWQTPAPSRSPVFAALHGNGAVYGSQPVSPA